MSVVIDLQTYRDAKRRADIAIKSRKYDLDEHDLAVCMMELERGERVAVGYDYLMVEALIEAAPWPVEAWFADVWMIARTDLVREGGRKV